MARLLVISGDELVQTFGKIGYVLDHTEGSHMILLHPSRRRLSIPRHRELGRGILRSLIRDAGLTRAEFMALFND